MTSESRSVGLALINALEEVVDLLPRSRHPSLLRVTAVPGSWAPPRLGTKSLTSRREWSRDQRPHLPVPPEP